VGTVGAIGGNDFKEEIFNIVVLKNTKNYVKVQSIKY
jgi:hypothetical protein